MYRPSVSSVNLHATKAGRDRRHPKVPMPGGIFAATATARRCRPRTRAQPDPLPRSDAAGRSQLDRRVHAAAASGGYELGQVQRGRGAWTRPSRPASRLWRSLRCPAGRLRRPQGPRMSVWASAAGASAGGQRRGIWSGGSPGRSPTAPLASRPRFSRRDGWPAADQAMRWDHPAAGQDLAQVVEHDHAVAEQAPSLLGVRSHAAGGVTVRAVSRRARG